MTSTALEAYKVTNPKKIEESLPSATIKSTLINLTSKAFGYLKYLAIAIFIGFNAKTDDYFIASSLLGIFLIFGDAFDSVGIPNLVQARRSSEKKFKELTGMLLTFTIFVGAIFTLAAFFLSPILPKIAIGFTSSNQAIVSRLLLLFVPYIFFYYLFHHFGAILRSQRRFTIFFIGQFIITAISSGCMFVVLPFIHDVWVIPLTFTIGQLIGTLFLLYHSKDFLSVEWRWDETTKEMGKQLFMLVAFYSLVHLILLTDNLFASLLEATTISALNYGYMIANLPSSILSFSILAITPLSEQKGNMKQINRYLKFLFLFSSLFILLTWLFITPVLRIFLLHGYFSSINLNLTAQATRYYILSLPFFLFWPVLLKACQVRNNFFFPIIAVFLFAVLNAVLKYVFVVRLQLGLKGIAASTFVGYFFLCVSLYIYLFFKENECNATEEC